MIRLLHITILVDNYPIIPLMIFQIIVVFAIVQRKIPFFRQQQLLNTIFIDHIVAIVRSRGGAANLMNRAKLHSIRTI